jgi:hypothetical protein
MSMYELNGQEPYRQHGDPSRSADPTPETIQLMTSAFRLQWSPGERRVRDQLSKWRWQAPHCPLEVSRLMQRR